MKLVNRLNGKNIDILWYLLIYLLIAKNAVKTQWKQLINDSDGYIRKIFAYLALGGKT